MRGDKWKTVSTQRKPTARSKSLQFTQNHGRVKPQLNSNRKKKNNASIKKKIKCGRKYFPEVRNMILNFK